MASGNCPWAATRNTLAVADTAAHLEASGAEYSNRKRPQPHQPKAMSAIRKYTGRACAGRILNAFDAGKLTTGEFCRSVRSNRIKPHEIRDFRDAIE